MSERRSVDNLFDNVSGERLSRRALLRRAVAAGIATPVVAGLLAACGGSDSTPEAPSSGEGSGGATETTTATSSTSSAASPSAAASPGTSQGATKFQVEEPKHKGGQFIYGTTSDAQTANPILSKDTTSGLIISMMFNGVMMTDVETTSPTGDLAKSWEIADDGITYSFVLTDGIKWHDGEPLTANDVKFTYDLMMNPAAKSPRLSNLTERVDSIEVQDDSHFTIKLKSPNSAFMASNMDYGILPQHILKDVDPAALIQHDFSKGKKGVTIGTGPFQFEEWIKDDHVTLVKYSDFWKGSPNLDTWIMKVVPNQTVLVQQLKTGEVDYGSIQPADVADMQKEQGITVHSWDTFSFTFYTYNLDTAKTDLFQEKEVRQAILYALDRQAMTDAVYFGLARVAVGTMPVLSWAYKPDEIKQKYDFSEDKAKELLDSAGWKPGSDGIREKNGKKLSFTLWTSSSSQAFQDNATIMQSSLQKIGVDCKPQFQEWNAFLDRITVTHDFEMFLVGFSWGVDPDQTTMWACDAYNGGFNMGKYCNPQVDKLLKDGLATNDQTERANIYVQMQNILVDDLPNAVLFFTKSVAGLNKRAHNVFPNAVSTTFNPEQWWVDE